jgi:anti-sigma regulatory factor (Ser/Thr protein kinase)
VRELALHVLDILQNAVEAGATRVSLDIREDASADLLIITVEDNGHGMDAAALARAIDPFYTSRTTRHVGLGLPLWSAAAERAGGRMTIQSRPGVGTTVAASFRLSHPDRQPLGDITGALLAFVLAERPVDLRYVHRTARGEFAFDTAEIRDTLAGMPINHPAVRQWLAEYLAEGEAGVRSQSKAGRVVQGPVIGQPSTLVACNNEESSPCPK